MPELGWTINLHSGMTAEWWKSGLHSNEIWTVQQIEIEDEELHL
jgi:hypothetical protein